MAGHSKWANIRFRKGAQDAKRGKLFTKLIREITVAAKSGGGDVDSNPRLRAAIDKSLSNNMTRDTIDRAVKRGSGGGADDNMEEARYEGYGPSGVAVLVDCLTDNRNRTVSEVRHAFSKMGGNLGTDGSVAYLFEKKGLLVFPEGTDEDKLMEVAIDAGAEDIEPQNDTSIEVKTLPESFEEVKTKTAEAGFVIQNAEVTFMPAIVISLDKTAAEKLLRMVDMLEDLDDVQNVYTNADIADDILSQL